MGTIRNTKVRFTCSDPECKCQEVLVAVPARQPTEDIVHWVQVTMGYAIKAAHTRMSPKCKATTMKHVLIATGDDGETIGGEREGRVPLTREIFKDR